MYCISEYLTYQSNELAKSLLLFSNGEKLIKTDIRAINYFKAYGANCFGNKLDKKS
jgi:DNA-directed RNA polymerase